MAGPVTPLTDSSDSSMEDISVHEGAPDAKGKRTSPWSWVISANFAEGLQYVIATDLFAIIIFLMGVDKGTALFWISLIQMPWVIKPLWSPLVDRYGTKRKWTYMMQGVVGLALLGAAAGLMAPNTALFATMPLFLGICLVFLFIIAFSGATHDIACDGFYMIALTEKQQSFFVGIRSTAFRLAMVAANGALLWLSSGIQRATSPTPNDIEVRVVIPQSQLPEAEYKLSQPDSPELVLEPRVLTMDAGTTASAMLSLKTPPSSGETKVVLLRFNGGSKSITANKERVEFTDKNWNQPIPIEFKAEERLKKSAATVFRATAGNVPLSWAVGIALCGVYYLICFFYHRSVLPHPHAEQDLDNADLPPFYKPLGALGVTVLLPMLLAIVGYFLLWEFLPPILKPKLLDQTPTPLQLKGFDFFFNVGSWLLIVGTIAVLYLIPPFGAAIRRFFNRMSDISGIGFADVFGSFFQKPGVAVLLAYLLTFRLGENQLTRIKNVFLLDTVANGGLEFSQDALGFTNSVVYIMALIVGGLLGGFCISKFGLKRIIWPMVLAMHLPNLAFVYMSYALPTNYVLINLLVGQESFFYGFGFTSYLMVMIAFAQGPYKTAHYAICTGFMALGVMIPGLWSGYLAELTGYKLFFWIVMISCIPGMLFIPFLKFDANFGKKSVA
ncbi:hypothetical protein IT570_06855 [Candidatus Sumerlaeota bacterium]|nr:hypothetical protein [Candidatus Sumerlaeota bacterium]